jgi:hypothetical protein
MWLLIFHLLRPRDVWLEWLGTCGDREPCTTLISNLMAAGDLLIPSIQDSWSRFLRLWHPYDLLYLLLFVVVTEGIEVSYCRKCIPHWNLAIHWKANLSSIFSQAHLSHLLHLPAANSHLLAAFFPALSLVGVIQFKPLSMMLPAVDTAAFGTCLRYDKFYLQWCSAHAFPWACLKVSQAAILLLISHNFHIVVYWLRGIHEFAVSFFPLRSDGYEYSPARISTSICSVQFSSFFIIAS